MCVCMCDNKSQVLINAIMIIKLDGVTARWDWKGRGWPLLAEWPVRYQTYSRKQLFDPESLNFFFFLTNCQSWIFGRFHIKTRFLSSLEKSKDIIRRSGYFCVAIVFPSTGNVFSLISLPFLTELLLSLVILICF